MHVILHWFAVGSAGGMSAGSGKLVVEGATSQGSAAIIKPGEVFDSCHVTVDSVTAKVCLFPLLMLYE